MEETRDQLLGMSPLCAESVWRVISLYRESRSIKTKYEFPKSIVEPKSDEYFTVCWNLVSSLLKDQPLKLSKFQAEMCGLQSELKEQVLLELCLQGMLNGSLKETYERLLTYIIVHPYINNPVLVGYAGIMAYLLWKQDRESENYYKKAKRHFSASLDLEASNSLFFVTYYHMLDDYQDYETIESLLNRLTPLMPRDLFLNQIKLDHYGLKHCDYCLALMNQDPLYPIHILSSLDANPMMEKRELVRLAVNRLDYEKNNMIAWNYILKYFKFVDPKEWNDRKYWWPEFHQFGNKDSSDPSIGFNHYLWAKLVLQDSIENWDWKRLSRIKLDNEKMDLLRVNQIDASELEIPFTLAKLDVR